MRQPVSPHEPVGGTVKPSADSPASSCGALASPGTTTARAAAETRTDSSFLLNFLKVFLYIVATFRKFRLGTVNGHYYPDPSTIQPRNNRCLLRMHDTWVFKRDTLARVCSHLRLRPALPDPFPQQENVVAIHLLNYIIIKNTFKILLARLVRAH